MTPDRKLMCLCGLLGASLAACSNNSSGPIVEPPPPTTPPPIAPQPAVVQRLSTEATQNSSPRLVLDAAGETRALWAEEYSIYPTGSAPEQRDRLVSRRTTAGTWQSPVEFAPVVFGFDVASDAAGNAVVVYRLGFSVWALESRTGWVSTWVGGAVDPVSTPRVATDGSSFGFIYNSFFTSPPPLGPLGFLAARIVDPVGNITSVSHPYGDGNIVAADRGYGLVRDEGPLLWLDIEDGRAWNIRVLVDDLTGANTTGNAIASNGTQYTVAWTRDAALRTSIYQGATVIQSLTLGTATSLSEPPVLASEGALWATAWIDNGDVHAAVFDASGASVAVALESTPDTAHTVRLMGRVGGFDAVWIQDEAGGDVIHHQRFDNGVWSPRPPIGTGNASVTEVSLAVGGGLLSATWVDQGEIWVALNIPG